MHALRFSFQSVILLDGKGSELCFYKDLPGVVYFGRDDTADWANVLCAITDEYSARYADLTRRGLRSAPPGDPRYRVTPHLDGQKLGKAIILMAKSWVTPSR